MVEPDPIVGLVNYLRAIPIAGGRVYGSDLPHAEVENMPRQNAVIRATGGIGNRGFATAGWTRFDLRCYGESPYDCMQLHIVTYRALKEMTAHIEVDANVKLLSVVQEVGPLEMQEQNVPQWPLVYSSYSVYAREVAVA